MGRIEDSLPLVAALPGRKILVPGNHDRCWAGAKNPGRWLTTYRDDAGIDTIVGAPARVRLGAGRLLADHFPYTGDSRAEDRYGPWRPADHGGWVDAWAGRPVPSSVVVAMICAGPAELDPLPWR